MKRNITLSLPNQLIKRAKVVAAQKEESLSQLIREALEEKISKQADYDKAKKRHMKILETGFDLGTKGKLTVSREELHERR